MIKMLNKLKLNFLQIMICFSILLICKKIHYEIEIIFFLKIFYELIFNLFFFKFLGLEQMKRIFLR
jgi:hypothetical protein